MDKVKQELEKEIKEMEERRDTEIATWKENPQSWEDKYMDRSCPIDFSMQIVCYMHDVEMYQAALKLHLYGEDTDLKYEALRLEALDTLERIKKRIQ